MVKKTRFVFLLLAMAMSLVTSSCSLVRTIGKIIQHGDDVIRLGDDIIRVPGRVSDELSDAVRGARASQEIYDFIKSAGLRAKNNTKQQVKTAIENGDSTISRESLWQVAYQTSMEELVKGLRNVQRQQDLSELGSKMADAISEQVENEVEEEYGERVMFID